MADKQTVRAVWELESSASRAEVWALFSDTDRYNRVAGFGFRFEEVPHADGRVTRRGTGKVLGVALSWQEQPFEYRENAWYRIRRRFEGGPAEGYVITLRLADRPGGTAIRYSIEVTPRNFLMRPVVALEMKQTRKNVTRALDALLEQLVEPGVMPSLAPPPLTDAGRAALAAARAGMADAELSQRLCDFVATAPLRDQDRMHPLRLARAWQAPPARVAVSLLDAVDLGLLTLSLDLICPLCRGPKKRLGALPRGRVTVHCTSCNVHYDGTYPDSVAVSFRTAPAVREFEVNPECLGSPANQVHVIAQDNLAADGEAVFEMQLAPGAYRVRTLPPRDTASLQVEPGGQAHAAIDVGAGGLRPVNIVAAPGVVRLAVHNGTDGPVAVALDRRAMPADVLSVGRLLRMPGVLERLPTAFLTPGSAVQNVEAAILAAETVGLDAGAADPLRAWAEAAGARAYRYQPGRLVARFARLSDAMRSLEASADLPWMQAAVGAGVVAVVGDDDEGMFAGALVDDTVAALGCARPGQVVVLEGAAPDEMPGWQITQRSVAVHADLRVHRLRFTGPSAGV